MRVEVKLFAMLRERAGTDTVEVELPDDSTVGDLFGELADLIGAMPVRAAVNRVYSDGDRALAPGDEVALIPPVSGGQDVHAAITPEPLSIERLARMVVRDRAGAVVTFAGITREVARLEYEAYTVMARERIDAILTEIRASGELSAIAAEHRVGSVPLGDPSVIVAASAPHRPEAFEGAREAIDRIKADVPIWKREITGAGGGRRWAEGTTPGAS